MHMHGNMRKQVDMLQTQQTTNLQDKQRAENIVYEGERRRRGSVMIVCTPLCLEKFVSESIYD